MAFLTTVLSAACNRRHFNCTALKNGKFVYYSSITKKKYLIERNDSVQIEIDDLTKEVYKNKIVWDNDCEYYLVGMPDSRKRLDKLDSFFASTPLKTTILKVAPTYYVFSSRLDSAGKV